MSRQDFRWKPLKKRAGPPQVFLGPLGGEPSAARFCELGSKLPIPAYPVAGGAQFALAGAPHYLHPWLVDRGSLTARIVARCNKFQVQVLCEMRARPFNDERTLIGLSAGRHAWVREVLLVADGIPVVFAHSILAPRDLRGAWHMAQAIGSRPLGAALFADPGIQRGPLSAARLTAAHPLQQHAAAAVGAALPTLWGRRSRFSRQGRPLLVTEVFLPGIARIG